MFLGGLPKNDDHWNNFLETIDETLKIIVHPQYLDNQIEKTINENKIYKKLYDDGRLFIVSESHYVKTQWGTFSLVCATLLMMQYMLVKFGNIFKKCILISSTDKPLYNYKTMYDELVSDNKSWFYFSNENGGYARDTFKKIYDYQGGVFNINDIVYTSQWCAIDQTHIPFYFDMDLLKNKQVTYIKVEKKLYHGINIVKSVSTNLKFQKYIDSHVGTYNINMPMSKKELKEIVKNGFSITGDETFFGAVLKHNIGEDFLENVRYYKISELEHINKIQLIDHITNKNTNDDITTYYNNTHHNKTTNKFNTWYGGSPGFNIENLKYLINLIKNKDSKNDSDKYLYIKNNKIITISQQQVIDFKNGTLYYQQSSSNNQSNNYDRIKIKDKYLKNKIYNDIYTISSTYTDWSIISIIPSSILRDFNSLFLYCHFEHSLIDYINDDPIILINKLLKSTRLEFNSNMDLVKGPSCHPVEYGAYPFLQIVNAYNIIEFFDIDDSTINGSRYSYNYQETKKLYKNIIIKYMNYLDIILNKKKSYYIFKTPNVEINIIEINFVKNKMFGYTITSDVLNNALHYGALFIRKVLENSDINLYTSQLLSLNTYAHKHDTLKNYTKCKNI
jgi:hypothetical protein